MTLVFPLSRDAFLGEFPSVSVSFAPSRQMLINGLRGGEILSAEVAPVLWEGSVTLPPMRKRRAGEIEALLSELEGPGRTFEAYKVQQLGPASDPLGVSLSGYSPIIESLDAANASRIRLSGLPSGFVLSRGDFLSFTYDPGTGPRQALHRITTADTADRPGVSGFMGVTPSCRPGAVVGASVELIRPFCLARLVPGSVSYGITSGNTTSGIEFRFRQTLRG